MSQRTQRRWAAARDLAFSLRVSHPNLFCWICLSVGKEASSVRSDISTVTTLSPTCKKWGWKAKKEKPKGSKKPCSSYALVCVLSYISYASMIWSDQIWYDMRSQMGQALKQPKHLMWFAPKSTWYDMCCPLFEKMVKCLEKWAAVKTVTFPV